MRETTAHATRVLSYLMLVLAIILPFVAPPPVSAASPITLDSSAQESFPTSITFKVKAQSDSNVVRLRLHYIVERENFATVVSEAWAQFSPGKSVDTQWLWDVRKGGPPPGGRIEYWWTAENASGTKSETPHLKVSFEDSRYKWQSITTGVVNLLWYQGDRTFADALMAAAQQALLRLGNDSGAVPQRQVRIYIYGSAQDMQGALQFPQEWTGGVTFSEFDIILIGVSPDILDWGKRAVAHELTHWITGQLTFNNYGAGLPVWLEEGLATYGEGPMTPDNQALLATAIRDNRLISVRSLSSPFSADSEQALLSYAESDSIVAFLIQIYDSDKMTKLLDVFHQGSDYDDALKQVYGFDQDSLDRRWRQSIGVKIAQAPVQEPVLAALSI
ncbi:MAG TPA: peptidase MA family metallohydrolase [Dehalococcoidia bacterium]|nr:peptidase MA family metallohydrolase [Dehalococcoidia bacterium]